MGDYEERTQCGDVYVELSAATGDSVQVRLGQVDAGALFETQLCGADNIFGNVEQTCEIAIGVEGKRRVSDFADALRWLADTLDARFGTPPHGPRLAK